MPEVGQLAPQMVGFIGCPDEDETAFERREHHIGK